MEALRHSAKLANQGHGQLVAVVADAGVGKSRLFYEFKATLEPYWRILEAFPISHGKASPYLPVLDLLHRYFGIKDDDDGHKRREKVAIGVARLDQALEDALPFLFELLGLVEGDDPLAGMDTQIKRRRTLDALRRILMRESLTQPAVVVFEDLHLIDEETQAFLNLLADSIRTARLLLLVNYRPEYSHPWNNKTYYRQLRLDPLTPESAEQMISAQLGDGQDLMTLKRLIIEKTEGNPFFIEETVQALFEDGALRRNGTVKLVKPLSLIKVPATVRAVLASRIDRLPQDQKELLQLLAVIGKKFPLALARGLIEKPDDDLDRMLNSLQVAELIYEQPGVGDVEYIFNHSVTQEVAYASLVGARATAIVVIPNPKFSSAERTVSGPDPSTSDHSWASARMADCSAILFVFVSALLRFKVPPFAPRIADFTTSLITYTSRFEPSPQIIYSVFGSHQCVDVSRSLAGVCYFSRPMAGSELCVAADEQIIDQLRSSRGSAPVAAGDSLQQLSRMIRLTRF